MTTSKTVDIAKAMHDLDAAMQEVVQLYPELAKVRALPDGIDRWAKIISEMETPESK